MFVRSSQQAIAFSPPLAVQSQLPHQRAMQIHRQDTSEIIHVSTNDLLFSPFPATKPALKLVIGELVIDASLHGRHAELGPVRRIILSATQRLPSSSLLCATGMRERPGNGSAISIPSPQLNAVLRREGLDIPSVMMLGRQAYSQIAAGGGSWT